MKIKTVFDCKNAWPKTCLAWYPTSRRCQVEKTALFYISYFSCKLKGNWDWRRSSADKCFSSCIFPRGKCLQDIYSPQSATLVTVNSVKKLPLHLAGSVFQLFFPSGVYKEQTHIADFWRTDIILKRIQRPSTSSSTLTRQSTLNPWILYESELLLLSFEQVSCCLVSSVVVPFTEFTLVCQNLTNVNYSYWESACSAVIPITFSHIYTTDYQEE